MQRGHDEESEQRTWGNNEWKVVPEKARRAENAWRLQRGHTKRVSKECGRAEGGRRERERDKGFRTHDAILVVLTTYH